MSHDYRYEQRLVRYLGGRLAGREEVWEAGQSERIVHSYSRIPMPPEGAYVPSGDGSTASWEDNNARLARIKDVS